MFKTLSLTLPVLMPSWRFFQTIEPSPRVQWALVANGDTASTVWREFRPSPQTISPRQMLTRLVWNPRRNEDLFVISCAERIQQNPTDHSIEEIRRRIQNDINETGAETSEPFMRFRLVFVRRSGTEIVEDVVFMSNPFPAAPC